MARRPADTAATADPVTPASLALQHWIADAEFADRSPKTLRDYRLTAKQLLWWLAHTAKPDRLAALAPDAVRQFLTYRRLPNAQGRWGRDHPESRRAAPGSGRHSYRNLRTFFRWAIAQEFLSVSPLDRVQSPNHVQGQREPLVVNEVAAVLNGARQSRNPERDEAVCLLPLDTGLRAAELCTLTIGDALSADMSAEVVGKARKRRVVFWSPETAKALRRHVRSVGRTDLRGALFAKRTGRPFGPDNVHECVADAAERGCVGRPCYPHLLRHTCAVNLLRGGANVLAVQRMMGHADLSILRRYVLESREDLQNAHRQASPVQALLGKGRRPNGGAR